jgi:hypothetical protein
MFLCFPHVTRVGPSHTFLGPVVAQSAMGRGGQEERERPVRIADIICLIISKGEVASSSVVDHLSELYLTIAMRVAALGIRLEFLSIVCGVGDLLVAHTDLMSPQMSF